MRRTVASPDTGSRTAGYVVCAVLIAPILPLASYFALNLVISPVSATGLCVLLTALLIGTVWLLRERAWQRDADS